jgi:hypothetical protein
MSIRLAESLHDQGRFDRDDVVLRYANWHKGPPHDSGSRCPCVRACVKEAQRELSRTNL